MLMLINDPTALFDQINTEIKLGARITRAYYEHLKHYGFSSEESFCLTESFHNAFWVNMNLADGLDDDDE